MTTTRHAFLINANRDAVKFARFADLPQSHQLAIVHYMAVDGDAWDLIDLDDLEHGTSAFLPGLIAKLPQYVECYGELFFGHFDMPAEQAKNSFMWHGSEIGESFSTWDEYHAWYLCASVPQYAPEGRWPAILSADDEEFLQDGNKRTHSYLRSGHADVPVIFFPNDQQFVLLRQSAPLEDVLNAQSDS